MGLFSRLGRITKAWYKFYKNSFKNFLEFLLTPFSEQSIHVDRVKDISKTGATYYAEYSEILTLIKYARDRNNIRENRLNIKDILNVISEGDWDIPIELINFDIKRWQKNQRRVQILKDYFIKYLFFNTFIIILNLINGTLFLAFYPIIAWGVGLLVLASNIYKIKIQESIELVEFSENKFLHNKILEELKKYYDENDEDNKDT